MAAVSLTVNPPDVSRYVSITDPNPDHYVATARSAAGYRFAGWQLICHYCERELYATSSSTFSDNVSARVSSGHPGPFELIATYYSTGSYAGVDLEWKITSSVPGDVWRGGVLAGGFDSAPPEDEIRTAHIPAGTSQSFRIVANPCLGFAFRYWDYGYSTVYDSIQDRYSQETYLVVRAPLVRPLEVRKIAILVRVTWVGFVFHAYAHLLSSGSVRVEFKNENGFRMFEPTSEGHDVWIDTSLDRAFHGGYPSLDWRFTAIEGPGVFKRWSDGGAKQHEVTLDLTSPLEAIAYFYTGQLLYGSSNKLLHGVSGNLVYDG